MSLKTVMDKVCRECGVAELSTIVSNTDRTAVELLQCCLDAGREIRGRVEWPNLYRDATVSAGVTYYNVPADFHRLIQGGAVRLVGSTYTPVMPVAAADVWAFIQSVPSANFHYFMTNGSIRFSPALPAGGAKIHYVTSNWIEGGQTEFINDTDEADFDDDLLAIGTIRNFHRIKGLPYEELTAQFEEKLASEARAAKGAS